MKTSGQQKSGSANGNRTRILALKGLRANRCTIAPLRDPYLSMQSPSNSCQPNRTSPAGDSRIFSNRVDHTIEPVRLIFVNTRIVTVPLWSTRASCSLKYCISTQCPVADRTPTTPKIIFTLTRRRCAGVLDSPRTATHQSDYVFDDAKLGLEQYGGAFEVDAKR